MVTTRHYRTTRATSSGLLAAATTGGGPALPRDPRRVRLETRGWLYLAFPRLPALLRFRGGPLARYAAAVPRRLRDAASSCPNPSALSITRVPGLPVRRDMLQDRSRSPLLRLCLPRCRSGPSTHPFTPVRFPLADRYERKLSASPRPCLGWRLGQCLCVHVVLRTTSDWVRTRLYGSSARTAALSRLSAPGQGHRVPRRGS